LEKKKPGSFSLFIEIFGISKGLNLKKVLKFSSCGIIFEIFFKIKLKQSKLKRVIVIGLVKMFVIRVKALVNVSKKFVIAIALSLRSYNVSVAVLGNCIKERIEFAKFFDIKFCEFGISKYASNLPISLEFFVLNLLRKKGFDKK